MTRRGVLLVLSSPSGAGKSTLARRLLAEDPGFELSVSVTTRAPRPGEVEGRDYYFVDKARFSEMAAAGELLEYAQVFDNSYGTPRQPVEAAVAAGRDVLFDVDWQGAQQLAASDLSEAVIKVFILPPSIGEIERRLNARATDAADVIARRMSKAEAEISHWAEYDYVLINDNLDHCFSQIRTIVAGERLRRPRQTGLFDYVGGLNREFQERS
ncbi:MAG: guanylate kinase [Pseudomonadota bacterium]